MPVLGRGLHLYAVVGAVPVPLGPLRPFPGRGGMTGDGPVPLEPPRLAPDGAPNPPNDPGWGANPPVPDAPNPLDGPSADDACGGTRSGGREVQAES